MGIIADVVADDATLGERSPALLKHGFESDSSRKSKSILRTFINKAKEFKSLSLYWSFVSSYVYIY